MMLIQAAANEWKVPASECTRREQLDHAQASGKKTTYGKVAEAAAKLEVPKDAKLKDPKDWKIAGKPLKRLDTADKVVGKMVYGIDVKLPGMLNAAIKALPGVRRQGEELRRRQGREACRASRRSCRSATTRSRSWPTRGGRPRPRSTRCRSSGTPAGTRRSHSATIAELLKEGLDAEQGVRRQQERRRQSRHRRRGEEGRSRLQLSVPEPRLHGADERHRALYGRQVRGLVRHAERRRRVRAPWSQASGLPADKCDVHKVMLGGGFGRRGRADYVIQAVQIAKQMPGTPIKLLWSREEDMHARLLSPDHPVQDDRRVRQGQQPDRSAHAHLRPVDPGERVPGAMKDGKDPRHVPGAQSRRARRRSATACRTC